ncbi:MAG: type II toxin-antitoxin system YafQ family toxin [Paludibacteraceae bacterium]|nr:type II toxin-antitoxin system YafQ family toxin [Paludibacteraceae bacterium]
MRNIVTTNQYKKDLKKARKSNLPEEELDDIIKKLAEDIPLPAKNHDHALTGNLKGFRECHIKPDWLLIYEKVDFEDLNILSLVRTGSHSELY